MTFDSDLFNSEYYERYPYIERPLWLDIVEIMKAYLAPSSVAKTPLYWLLSDKYAVKLKNLGDHACALKDDGTGKLFLLGLPVVIVFMDTNVTAVTGTPYHCRVGDFVIPNALPYMEPGRNTYYMWPELPIETSSASYVDIIKGAANPLVFKRQEFFRTDDKKITLWGKVAK